MCLDHSPELGSEAFESVRTDRDLGQASAHLRFRGMKLEEQYLSDVLFRLDPEAHAVGQEGAALLAYQRELEPTDIRFLALLVKQSDQRRVIHLRQAAKRDL